MVNRVLGKLQTGFPSHYRKELLLLVKKLLYAAHRQEGRREPRLLPPACRAASGVHTDRAQQKQGVQSPSRCTTKQNTQGWVWRRA